jgi:hypothetical protein
MQRSRRSRPLFALDGHRRDYNKMNQTQNGRPVRVVDRGATPIRELFA